MSQQVSFHRMRPDSRNMVVEPIGGGSRVLCVECGWEAVVMFPTAPWPGFMNHPCRLVHTMTSGGD